MVADIKSILEFTPHIILAGYNVTGKNSKRLYASIDFNKDKVNYTLCINNTEKTTYDTLVDAVNAYDLIESSE